MTETINNNNLNIVIKTKELAHALQFAGSVVEKRNVMQELSNIKLSAKDGVLSIGATDMDLYLNQEIGAEILSEGETTVSTQTLADLVRKIPDEEISVKQINENSLEIIGKNCRFELLTLPADQFPVLDSLSSDDVIDIDSAELARIVEYTSYSMSTDETRYNLNGIYIHIKDKSLCSVATDAHRLAFASSEAASMQDDFGVIVPRKTVSELLKILKDGKNSVSNIKISFSNTKIQFQCSNWVLISKLVDGVFPDYSHFIPADNENSLVVNTKHMAASIDRVSVMNAEKFKSVKFFITNEGIKLSASGEAKGAGVEEIPYSDKRGEYCRYSGEELSIGFNPKYLSDVLGALAEEKVEIKFKDSFSPVLILSEDNAKDRFVVMPVKV